MIRTGTMLVIEPARARPFSIVLSEHSVLRRREDLAPFCIAFRDLEARDEASLVRLFVRARATTGDRHRHSRERDEKCSALHEKHQARQT